MIKSYGKGYVLYCDIADFYNQIYHHTYENQLIASGFCKKEQLWIKRLITSTTEGVSRGLPVGPHAIHLIAEASLIPIDNSLVQQGIDFIRYVDDILVFCNNLEEAKSALSKIANTLDKHQRIILQKHKTKIYIPEEFRTVCNSMIEDRPINQKEDDILKLINKYSGGDPYKTIYYNQISKEDWESISEEIINDIISEYLNQKDVDYIRLCWFYRRLAQVGHPGAIEISLKEIERLTPCFANVCMYLGSVQKIEPSKWKEIGANLLELLNSHVIKDNEYFRLLLLSLFTKNEYINHFRSLVGYYK